MKMFHFIVIALFSLASPSPVDALTFPDRGRAAVVDAAHVIAPADAAELNRRIVAWDQATGHQLAIATVPSLQGHEIADYGYQLGRAWGLGRKGIDDGILLLIAPTERKVRIDVGRGLEGDLTDAETSVILSSVVVRRLKAGDIGAAAAAGADAIMSAVPAKAGDLANAPQPVGHPIWWIALGLGIVTASAWIARRRRIAREAEERAATLRQAHDNQMRLIRNEIERGARPSGRNFSLSTSAPIRSSYRQDNRSSQVVPPVALPEATYSPPAPDTSNSWGSSDSGSSSSSDWGSSGFDSGGGSFSGGGSDSSW